MNRRGFSLLELILALGLSSVIMFAFMQLNRSMHQFIEKSRESFVADRKVCLLFNQIERDITSASIPVISPKQDEKGDDKKDDAQQKPTVDSKDDKKDKKKDEKKLRPFVADIFDGETSKRKGKKLDLLRSMSMITLNSLETYDDQSPRLLRVFYELKENKNRPFKDKKSYSLYRKQTTDLYNVKVKESDDKDSKDKKDKKALAVKTYLVADTIEFISLEFHRVHNLPKDEKDKDKDKKKDQPPISGFVWGQKEETENILPEYVLVTISLWSENYKTTTQYECMMPLFSYNAPLLPKIKDNKSLDPNATTTQQAGQPAQPGQPQQGQQGQLAPFPQDPNFGGSLDMKNIFKAAETMLAQMSHQPPSFALLEPGYLDAVKKGMKL